MEKVTTRCLHLTMSLVLYKQKLSMVQQLLVPLLILNNWLSLLAILFEQPCIEIVLTETTFNWQSRLRQNCFRGKMTLKKID